MYWALLAMSYPGSEPSSTHWCLPSLPHIHTAETKISPVLGSTRMPGSPIPFSCWGSPPHSPMSMITRWVPQVCPPSVLRLSPTSMSSCRSRDFRLRMS